MKGLHHVGITVKTSTPRSASTTTCSACVLERAQPLVRGPGAGPAVGVPGAALRQVSLLLGDTTLELLEYRSPPSETTRPLPSNSIGASHVAFLVDDIEAKMAELEAKGSSSSAR